MPVNGVPVVNLQDPSVLARETEALAALDSACRDHGFFLVTGHGLDTVIEDMWSEAEAFFDAPRPVRLSILRTEENPLGYFDRELTKQKRDLKEVFDFTRPETDIKRHNQWPAGMPGFKQGMSDYYEAMSTLAQELLELLYETVGVELEGCPRGDADTSNARLNNYPVDDPLSNTEQNSTTSLGDMALHHHTDPGLITLLVQDATGGLQTLSSEHGWIDVPPLPGSIIVNLGDSLQAWSNDQYKAAVHRVVPMTRQRRMSTPYFYHPSRDAIIAPHRILADGNPLYRPFSWREFIQGRVDDNYADLGVEDTQVSKFRIAVPLDQVDVVEEPLA
jgi:isopenicillin N synthase-like dioxygenase